MDKVLAVDDGQDHVRIDVFYPSGHPMPGHPSSACPPVQVFLGMTVDSGKGRCIYDALTVWRNRVNFGRDKFTG